MERTYFKVVTNVSQYTLRKTNQPTNQPTIQPTDRPKVFFEKVTGPQLVKKFPTLMEPKGSLPHSQDPATCPCLSQINPVHVPHSPS
jgi:hypothetical protein